jgi:hypothetical protein
LHLHDRAELMDTRYRLERLLQCWRFKKAKPHIEGGVLDVGGNSGELGEYMKLDSYVVCNDVNRLPEGRWRTIVSLATLEHLTCDVTWLFRELHRRMADSGRLVVTTPSPSAHVILSVLAWCGLLDRKNLNGHVCYWRGEGLTKVAESCGFTLILERRFECGLNQLLVYGKEQ